MIWIGLSPRGAVCLAPFARAVVERASWEGNKKKERHENERNPCSWLPSWPEFLRALSCVHSKEAPTRARRGRGLIYCARSIAGCLLVPSGYYYIVT